MRPHEIKHALNARAGDADWVVPGSGGFERSDVVQVCPECGGKLTSEVGSSILVTVCWACEGRGTMNDAQLDTYQSRLNARAANEARAEDIWRSSR